METKYKVGDRVTIRRDLEARHYDEADDSVLPDMLRYAGKEVTIIGVNTNSHGIPRYIISLDGKASIYMWYDCFFEEKKEEKKMEVKTLFDTTITYNPTFEERAKLIKDVTTLLEDFGYETNSVGKLVDEFYKQKGWLIAAFSKVDGWEPETYRIVRRESEFREGVQIDNIMKFFNFITNNFYDVVVKPVESRSLFFTVDELSDIIEKLDRIIDRMAWDKNFYYCGMSREEVIIDRKRLGRLYDKLPRWVTVCAGRKYYTSSYENMERVEKIYDLFMFLRDILKASEIDSDGRLDEDTAEKINEQIDTLNLKSKASKDMSMSKYVGKLCRELGFNKIVDVQDVSFYDNDGNFHHKMKDMGYNYYYALFGDSFKMHTFTDDFILSVNILDFLTMSFLNGTASCQTIDKDNTRDASSTYEGCYSSGTLSLGLDRHSIIAYIPYEREDEEDLPWFEKTKLRRQLFALGEDKLYQSRLYPDGRDGGEMSYAADFRRLMQSIVADAFDTSNIWTLKRGSSAVKETLSKSSDATFYNDYACCEDVSVSYLRQIDGILNYKGVEIGVSPICPECGYPHRRENNIMCYSCRDDYDERDYDYYCERCDDGFYEDDDDAVFAEDGTHFCCESCAERSGYYYVSGAGWYHEDDTHYDEWTEESFVGDYYYVSDGNGCEYLVSESTYDYYGGRDEIDDAYYISEDSDDWIIVNSNGHKYNVFRPVHDEIVEIDGIYYLNEEEAHKVA